MSKRDDLPPPVTKDSPKSDLWEELQAAREEIDTIHGQLKAMARGQREMFEEVTAWQRHAAALEWQIEMVRASVNRQFQPPKKQGDQA